MVRFDRSFWLGYAGGVILFWGVITLALLIMGWIRAC